MFTNCKLTRSRTIPGPTFFIKQGGPLVAGAPRSKYSWSQHPSGKFTFGGTQITESDRNRWPPPKRGPLVDLGSEFYTQKKEIVNHKLPFSICYVGKPSDPDPGAFQGTLIANCFNVQDTTARYGDPILPLSLNWPPDMSSSRASLNVKGATAVAAVSPTNQIANAASAIGEALQDIPAIPGVALWESRLKALGTVAAGASEFLNYVFAVSPTISDITDFIKGVDKVDKLVDQFIRDSGRSVRREFHYPKERSETVTTLPHTYSPAGWFELINQPGKSQCVFAGTYGPAIPGYETRRTRVVERETWFSGAFTYHLPNGYDKHSQLARRALMARFLGASPDLNTLWQLTPWSWAVDWFTDAGSFVKNLQSLITYGTVLRYGYVMETTTVTDTYTAGAPILAPNAASVYPKPYPAVSPITLRVTTKKRIQANPFGFGIQWDGLSTVQQAIIAALGITRVVR